MGPPFEKDNEARTAVEREWNEQPRLERFLERKAFSDRRKSDARKQRKMGTGLRGFASLRRWCQQPVKHVSASRANLFYFYMEPKGREVLHMQCDNCRQHGKRGGSRSRRDRRSRAEKPRKKRAPMQEGRSEKGRGWREGGQGYDSRRKWSSTWERRRRLGMHRIVPTMSTPIFEPDKRDPRGLLILKDDGAAREQMRMQST